MHRGGQGRSSVRAAPTDILARLAELAMPMLRDDLNASPELVELSPQAGSGSSASIIGLSGAALTTVPGRTNPGVKWSRCRRVRISTL